MKRYHTSVSSAFPQFDGACDISLDDSESHSSANNIQTPDNPLEHSWFSQLEESSLLSPPELSCPAKCLPEQPIPVRTSARLNSPSWSSLKKRKSYCKTIRRNNKAVAALSLPTITVYNMRSIWSKLDSLATDMEERSVHLSMLSEVWEKKENPQHQARLEEFL